MERQFLILDYETFSETDLTEVGAYEYSLHPSTEILCVAWRHGTKEELRNLAIRVWCSWDSSKDKLEDLIYALEDPNTTIFAHNAAFEQVITNNVLPKYYKGLKPPPIERWRCTAAMAAAHALPRKLEDVCQVLKLKFQKDSEGHRLMLKVSKPRKASKHNAFIRHYDIEEMERLLEYCIADISAETELLFSVPQLSQKEQTIWQLDQKINQLGFRVDRVLVLRVLEFIKMELRNLNATLFRLTDGEIDSANQTAKMMSWLKNNLLTDGLDNLQAETIRQYLTKDLSYPAREVLEIRQQASKTSTAKYETFESMSRSDSRIRDSLMFHAASTGRWGGRGVQPQNFPRPKIKNTELLAEHLKTFSLEEIRFTYGNPMNVFSDCLRSVIIATPGKEIFCGDYASIEARVLFWVADHQDGVRAFKNNRPMYEEMASQIYGKKVTDIKKDSVERFVGKEAVLGCGYGMGPPKFAMHCKNKGIEVSDDLAKVTVNSYRATHYPIPQLWKKFESAAITALDGKTVTVNRTKWYKKGRFLYCELPSGRKLAYCDPEIKQEMSPWDDTKRIPKLYFYSVNPKTKQWGPTSTWGGTLTENVVQAISRDLMAEAMLRIDATGYDVILTVHDEIVAERKIGEGNLKEFENLMAEVPDWAQGCPVKVEGWAGARYKK